jgi:glycosyltransferase involved in cell wall biosynthesis
MTRLVHITTVPTGLGFFRGHIGYLKSRGYTIAAISSPGLELEQYGATENIEVRGVPMERRMAPLADLVSLARLIATLIRLRPQIVHSTTPKAGLLGTIAARLVGAKAVLSVFGLVQMTRTGASRKLLDLTTRISCALAHRVWCDSFSIRDYLIAQRLCAAKKIFVAGQGSVAGADPVRFDPARFDDTARRETRSAWQTPADAFVIGFVGRIVHDKGIHELAGAWRNLSARYPDMHLLLVGPAEDTDPILPEDERLLRNDPRVHFTGRQSDVPRLFAAMDIFVMPSYREGFGVTNIEAAALALPVISTFIPGCVDSVADGKTGTLVEPRDTEALTAAIERYYTDPILRADHGRAGRQRVLADFQPERVFSDVAAVYEALLGRKV